MAGVPELAIKYSNEIYATKKDVQRELKTPLIDNIWSAIVNYRANFKNTLELKHITQQSYSICLTPTINNRINELERKLLRLSTSYFRLEKKSYVNEFNNIRYKKSLKALAEYYNVPVDNETLENIVSNKTAIIPANTIQLNRYYQCLRLIENKVYQEINDSTLADFYSFLTGEEELTRFYRTTEVDNLMSKFVVNRLYIGIPANTIEKSMDELFEFIRYSNVSLFVKAVAAFYYSYYVKPFEFYSEEISLLLFKKILANNDFGNVAAMIDFESLLINKEELEKQILESQSSLDLTYIVYYFLNKMNSLVDEALDDIVEAQNKILKEEFYEREVESVKKVEETNVPQSEEPVEETPVISIPKSSTLVIPKPITQPEEKYVATNVNTNIAISNVPLGLSEQEASVLENRLVEMEPTMSRAQAYFYARHCTIGMNYTIAQFKKCLGCAYETARTSMDNLVRLGYYRKEPLKNKYVYTPIKRN